MKKSSKKHFKNTVILMSCLFILFIGFQNCAKKNNNTPGDDDNGDKTLPSGSIEVTGITDDSTTPQQSWEWDCNSPPCTFRFAINESSTYTFPQNQKYIDEKTTRKTDVTGNYYLHIQAKKGDIESAVKIVSIVIGQSNTGGEKNPFLVDFLDTSGSHTCSLKTGKVKCWGLNDKGQLGYGSTDNIGDGPNEISELADVDVHPNEANHLTKFIATGGQHTCVVLENECIKCWGNNENGQLGYSDTSNDLGDAGNEMGRNLGPVGGLDFKVKTHGEEDAKEYAVLATGDDHTCAITKDDKIRCWGANDKGQLGQNSAESTFIEPDKIPDIDIHNDPDETDQAKIDGFLPQHVATGAKHTCALLDNTCVKCWGENKYGQLGYEVAEDNLNLGDDTDEMGTKLPPVGGLDFKVKAIAIGDSHTCAIMKSDDSVQCWGLNDKGQLGLGSTSDAADNKVTLDATNLTATQVDLGSHIAKSITAGAKHTCVTLDDDSTKCWGLNESGQLGQGSTDDKGDDETVANVPDVSIEAGTAVAGGDNTCFVLDDGKVKCWGDNQYGQLAKEHICSLGNGSGYSASSNDKCNTPAATDVMGKTVDTIDYLSFE